jgi:hypothetical protein
MEQALYRDADFYEFVLEFNVRLKVLYLELNHQNNEEYKKESLSNGKQ